MKVCIAGVLSLLIAITAPVQARAQTPHGDVQGNTTLYQGDTTIGDVTDLRGYPVARLSARAGTIIHYNTKGDPDFVGYASPPKWIIQGDYGTDNNGPKNKGRLFYTQKDTNQAVPIVVFGSNTISSYHLKYLELTTAGDETNGFHAYATRAVAFDNKVETLSDGRTKVTITNTFALPEGAELNITNGWIRIGNSYIAPDYIPGGKFAK